MSRQTFTKWFESSATSSNRQTTAAKPGTFGTTIGGMNVIKTITHPAYTNHALSSCCAKLRRSNGNLDKATVMLYALSEIHDRRCMLRLDITQLACAREN
ncbi:hypothetical protein A0H81_07073 [Grifola frondosa]|uniref:Uncharacterized protein n=1 Tax=Grifola frondosa TaxID=5627 RepID=A0A1C7M9G0_GRIFR|nr:hypothetical protein A0H81_07073 [Grifola frondosa]